MDGLPVSMSQVPGIKCGLWTLHVTDCLRSKRRLQKGLFLSHLSVGTRDGGGRIHPSALLYIYLYHGEDAKYRTRYNNTRQHTYNPLWGELLGRFSPKQRAKGGTRNEKGSGGLGKRSNMYFRRHIAPRLFAVWT